ncbi:PAS domain S-box protein [Sulfuricaulis sp.]|uniref:PAS domain S-box protein n=1 Tax=Sulfuricaulis sp. TaxID=2003553 RepID=UPI00355ACC70
MRTDAHTPQKAWRTPLRITLGYAVFAVLWILTSDWALFTFVPNPAYQPIFSQLKGLGFVAVTGLFLYLLLRAGAVTGPAAVSDAVDSRINRLASPRFVLGAFIGLSATILITSYFVTSQITRLIREEKLDELNAMADLKADEIERWIDERWGDASVFAGDRGFGDRIHRWFDLGDNAERDRVVTRLQAVRFSNDYESVLLYDARGRLRLEVGETHGNNPRLERLVNEAVKSRITQFSDLYRVVHRPDHIHLDFVMPLTAGSQDKLFIAGVIVLRVDPNRYLYGQIQRWPLQAQNGETLIVRREGDEVMYLSKLRYHPGSGLTLRMPVTTPGLPAAQAVQGEIGTFEGTDYRGVSVFSVLRPIYGTPWYMIAEIDREEALAPIRQVQLVSATITLVAIMLAGLMVGLGWRQQARNFALQQRMQEAEKQALVKHFEYLSHNANDLILLADESLHVAEINDRAHDLIGYTREEMIGTPLIQYRSKSAREMATEDYARFKSEGRARYETTLNHRDGSEVPIEVSAARVEVDGQNYYQLVVRDISERKRHEAQLMKARDFYVRILATFPNPIWRAGTDAKRDYFNQAWLKFTGRALEQELGDGLTQGIHPNDLQRYVDTFLKAFRAREPFLMEYRLRHYSGEYRWIADHGEPIHDPNGTFLGYIGSCYDIHDSRLHGEKLAAAAEQFQGLVEQSIAGIFIIVDGRFAYVNPRLAEILGYKPSDLVGREVTEIVMERDRAALSANLARCLSGEEESQLLAYLCRRRDGSTVDVGAHINRAKHGGQPAVIGVVQDISDKKRAEARIQDYIQKLERGMLGTIKAVSVMSELRDPYTYGHEQRVGDLSGAIAAEMGLDAQVVKGLQIAGYVHDIGKIVVPAEILAKPTKLTKAEFELIKSHPEQGYEVLKDIDFPWPVAQVALQHHERLDGSGYPQGLKGDQILLEARILAVADVVEAMAAHRPYRASLGIDAALEEVRKYRGVKYDSAAVDACVRLFHERSYALKTVL